MNDSGYWVDISQRGIRLGAGFLVTKRFVITANHCLRAAAIDAPLDLSFSGGELISGRVQQQSPESDLALIVVLKTHSSPIILPSADRSRAGEKWRVPYRPSAADPLLSGDVLDASVTYQCEGGDTVEALQLGCAAHLGDYSGYSGGPVERPGRPDRLALLGILLEQYPDRQDPQRNSDVLFATTVAEALRRFDVFDVGHLLTVLLTSTRAPATNLEGVEDRLPVSLGRSEPMQPPLSTSTELAERIQNADMTLHAFKRWEMEGVLDATQVSLLRLRIAKSVADTALGEDV